MKDEVTLITPDDVVIGSMDKIAAHKKPGQLHRAISVFLFRNESEPELLLQQRSPKKIVGQNLWANTVCGNVWPEETYLECAVRRLSFELGLEAKQTALRDVHNFIYYADCSEIYCERELDHVFVGWYADVCGTQALMANPSEVTDTQWIPWENCKNNELSGLSLAPWFTIMMSKNDLITAIEEQMYASY